MMTQYPSIGCALGKHPYAYAGGEGPHVHCEETQTVSTSQNKRMAYAEWFSFYQWETEEEHEQIRINFLGREAVVKMHPTF